MSGDVRHQRRTHRQAHFRTLGTATELRAQRNYSAGHRLAPWLGHLMVSRQETARPLLTPGEVMQLPPDEAVVMVSSVAPIRRRSCALRGRNFRRVLPPPPRRRQRRRGPPSRPDDWSGWRFRRCLPPAGIRRWPGNLCRNDGGRAVSPNSLEADPTTPNWLRPPADLAAR